MLTKEQIDRDFLIAKIEQELKRRRIKRGISGKLEELFQIGVRLWDLRESRLENKLLRERGCLNKNTHKARNTRSQ